MVTVQLIGLGDKESWDHHLTQVPYYFAHTHAYNFALAKSLVSEPKLMVINDEQGIALCPIIERQHKGTYDIATPYGYSGFVCKGVVNNIPNILREFSMQQGYVAGYFQQHPCSNKVIKGDEWSRAKTAYTLSLQPAIDAILASMPKKQRYDIRKCEQHAVTTENKSILAPLFIQFYTALLKDKSATSVYRFSNQTLTEWIENPDYVLIGTGVSHNQISSIGVFTSELKYGEYLFMASSQKNYDRFTLWQAIKRLKSLGCKELNLGGGISENDGVAEFKRRFGAVETATYCLKQIYDETRYATLCSQADVSVDSSSYFPAYYR